MARLVKTATYCIMHMLVAISLVWAMTGNWKAALAIGLLEPVVQTVMFYLHDMFWSKRESRIQAVPA